jgi:hypothetical protein
MCLEVSPLLWVFFLKRENDMKKSLIALCLFTAAATAIATNMDDLRDVGSSNKSSKSSDPNTARSGDKSKSQAGTSSPNNGKSASEKYLNDVKRDDFSKENTSGKIIKNGNK